MLAPYIVPLLFGDAWIPAVEPTQILALAGMLAAVLTGYSQVMLAIGKPRRLMWFNIGRLVLYGGVVFLASRHGLITVAIAVVGAYLVILIAAYALLLGPSVGISVRRLVPELAPAVCGCLALAAVSVPLTAALDGLPRFLVIALVAPVGVLAYGSHCESAFPAAWADARTLAVQVLGPLGRAPGPRPRPEEGSRRDTRGTPTEPAPAEPAPAGVA